MAKRATKKPVGRPKSQALPGMSDRAIKPLEDAAEAYADIRDQRIALNADEAKLKSAVLALMKKHDKKIYRRDGIEIVIVPPGDETVKVRVRHGGDDDEDEEGGGAQDDGADNGE